MAELTIQQQIAEKMKRLQEIGGRSYRNVTSELSRLGQKSPIGSMNYVVGREQVTNPEVRKLELEIRQLMNQFSPGYTGVSGAERILLGTGRRTDNVIQQGLAGTRNLGEISLSVPVGKNPNPVAVEALASRYGMSVPQFLQMNPQYAGRSILNPGEVFKVAGEAPDLATQLEGQQMRYEANISPEQQRMLSDPKLLSGLMASTRTAGRYQSAVADWQRDARRLARERGVDYATGRDMLREEKGRALTREQADKYRALKAGNRSQAQDILGGLGSLVNLSGANENRIIKAAGRGRNIFDPNSEAYGELSKLFASEATLRPLSLDETQRAYAQQTATLPPEYQAMVEQAQAPVDQMATQPVSQPVSQPAAGTNWYDAPQYNFLQPGQNMYAQQPYQPQASDYGSYMQQPMYYGGYPQQQSYYGGYPQQQPMYYGGGGYPQKQPNMYGGLGGLGYMSLGGSGLV